jgi:hypothetical protein
LVPPPTGWLGAGFIGAKLVVGWPVGADEFAQAKGAKRHGNGHEHDQAHYEVTVQEIRHHEQG